MVAIDRRHRSPPDRNLTFVLACFGDIVEAADVAKKMSLSVNAGHDLDLQNLKYLKKGIPHLAEVSIGHALFCDALYYGIQNTIQMYKRQLQ